MSFTSSFVLTRAKLEFNESSGSRDDASSTSILPKRDLDSVQIPNVGASSSHDDDNNSSGGYVIVSDKNRSSPENLVDTASSSKSSSATNSPKNKTVKSDEHSMLKQTQHPETTLSQIRCKDLL